MIRSDKRIRLCCVLLVCNLAFIWGNSLMPGEVSGAFSDWVTAFLEQLMPGEDDGLPGGGLYLAGNAVFLLYDFGFSKLICFYRERVDRVLRKT